MPEPTEHYQNRSLRLWEVLQEEYNHLHSEELPQAQLQSEHYSLGVIDLLNTNQLLTELKKWFSASPSNSEIPLLPNEVRYKRLAEWLLASNAGAGSLEGKGLLDLVKAVLKKKLEADLPTEEPWMQDANLRSFTRGLLKAYFNQQRPGFKARERIKKLFRTEAHPNPPWAQETEPVSRPLLNRLLLEDVYGGSEYVERKYSGQSEMADGNPLADAQFQLLNSSAPDEIATDGYIKRVDDQNLEDLFKNMLRKTQTALCLSGGGIRSATFALGIVQGLIKASNTSASGMGWLPGKFTYLSTVSGGGYLGGWLSAWISQEGVQNVYRKLGSIGNIPFQTEAEPLQHLRRYSNYLSPNLGLFSADTWTLVAIYLRNLVLIWLVILPFLAALVAIPWIAVTLIASPPPYWPALLGLLIGGAILMIISDKFVYVYRPKSVNGHAVSKTSTSQADQTRDQGSFLWNCLLPGTLAILVWTIVWYWFLHNDYAGTWLNTYRAVFTNGSSAGLTLPQSSKATGLVMVGTLSLLITEWVIYYILDIAGIIPSRYKGIKKGRSGAKVFFALVLVGICAGPLLLLVAQWIPTHYNKGMNAALFTVFSFPAFLLTMLLISFLYTGISSSFMEDAEREWGARYSAWFLIVSVVWMAITGVVLFGPHLAHQAIGWVTTTGLVSGYLTALLGQSSTLNGKPSNTKAASKKKLGLSDLLSKITLPIASFITLIFLLITLSFFDMYLMKLLNGYFDKFYSSTSLSIQKLSLVSPLYPFLLAIGLLALGLFLAWTIDTNRFSLHAMYRARLIRAYLGASRPAGERRPDPFTGFDEADNIFMGNLKLPSEKSVAGKPEKKPFHIINIALNLVAGRNLAWQERKAASFTVSPLHAGNLFLGYRKTYISDSQKKPIPGKNTAYYGGERGITLGTAMTISGAAVSPNHGYHSSPLVAFFMTMFNARLGCWLGNPGPTGDSTFNLSSPRLAIRQFFNEMIGNTDDTSDYVFLSDGGHFDNLGLYEMVLRRNRFVLVSDASCDEDCTLEDLGNAIRKIRIDLGIAIDFPKGFNIRSRTAAVAGQEKNWALGRIRYSEVDMPRDNSQANPLQYDGILLYVKPGFTETAFDGPRDIFNYASISKSFPHESTGDQFFSESQFESYRALGIYIVDCIKKQIGTEFKIQFEELFTDQGIQKCLGQL